ncbi:hypothetical protein [Streptomyces sp. NPDC058653]|uniref:LexA family protein n=1 Tax=Streptomyces sp. NPDC058653 TaxID=3346576 RepID=UPI00364836D8
MPVHTTDTDTDTQQPAPERPGILAAAVAAAARGGPGGQTRGGMSGSGVPTERQVQILRTVRGWIAEHGEGPSLRQTGDLVGLSSTAPVAYQLSRSDGGAGG